MVIANQKSLIDIHTKRKRNPNITPKIVIKSQENKRGKGGKHIQKKSKTINKMRKRTYIWIITLNVNGLNAPNKRHRVKKKKKKT